MDEKFDGLAKQDALGEAKCASNSAIEFGAFEQLRQIARSPVWDGNLISKTRRDDLHRHALIDRAFGWNFLTTKGVEYAVVLGILRA